LNSNRSNRRRGRGNRAQGGNGNNLNRIDSRARGNAAQLLEKYRKLAQEAQHNGDRVQMEYYLQFADHYFRVLADNKARLEEQRSGRRNDVRDPFDDFGEDESDFDRARRPDRRQGERPSRDMREGEPRPAEELEYGLEGEPVLLAENGELVIATEADPSPETRTESLEEPRPQARRRQQRKPRAKAPGQDADQSVDKDVNTPADSGEAKDASEEKEPGGEKDPGEVKVETRRRRGRKRSAEDRNGIDPATLPPSIRGDNAGGDQSGALEIVE
jgi:hypothetical protein